MMLAAFSRDLCAKLPLLLKQSFVVGVVVADAADAAETCLHFEMLSQADSLLLMLLWLC